MLRKACIVAALAGISMTSIAAAANQEAQVTYVGGHDTARLVVVQPKIESAPYALTGSQLTRTEPMWVGSRFVGVRIVPVK